MRTLPVVEVKRDFRQVLDAAERGEETVVLRRGRPVAVVVPFRDPESRTDLPVAQRPGGLLSIIGLFDDWDEMDSDIAAVVAHRQEVVDRPPPELE
jgi:prevent-host-death family protein